MIHDINGRTRICRAVAEVGCLQIDTSGRSTFVPRCLPCFSFGGLATASPNSATNSDAFGIAIRNLMGGTARQGALPTSLNHDRRRSEEHTSELQTLMRISYAVFCLKKKTTSTKTTKTQRNKT